MNDDFNTREALAALLSIATAINRHLDAREAFDYRGLRRAVETLEELGGDVLGFSFGRADDADGRVELAGDLVDLLLEVREREREAGNYDRADALRDDLEALGVTVEDDAEGTSYRL
jgi:cysteinyl-tRNA synthetase